MSHPLRLVLLVFIVACLLPGRSALAQAPIEVVLSPPLIQAEFNPQNNYQYQLLKLALSKSGQPFHLSIFKTPMPQERALKLLQLGREINVVWSMTSPEREADVLPIRIPIFKGLIGWRLLLIRASDKARFARVNSLADLSVLTAGQGHDWPDTAILRANGLPVAVSNKYALLFPMLEAGRFDYFPRSVTEIWSEEEAHRKEGLIIEPHLVLHYPTAAYFFINLSNTALAKMITDGLNKTRSDGSFDQLFLRFHGANLARANLGQRTVIEMNNPFLSLQSSLLPGEYWYHPK